MSFESTVVALAKGAASITDLVPVASIWMGEVPQGTAAPFIVFARLSTDPQNTTDEGASGTRAQLDNIQLQAACYGRTMTESLAIAAAVRRVLTNENSLRALCVGQDTSGEDDVNLRGQLLTFSCWYAEDLAAP
jgi:hypothetical protein